MRSRELLIRLYPGRWRARYGAEFADLLVEMRLTPLRAVDIVRGAFDARRRLRARQPAQAASRGLLLIGLSALIALKLGEQQPLAGGSAASAARVATLVLPVVLAALAAAWTGSVARCTLRETRGQAARAIVGPLARILITTTAALAGLVALGAVAKPTGTSAQLATIVGVLALVAGVGERLRRLALRLCADSDPPILLSRLGAALAVAYGIGLFATGIATMRALHHGSATAGLAGTPYVIWWALAMLLAAAAAKCIAAPPRKVPRVPA